MLIHYMLRINFSLDNKVTFLVELLQLFTIMNQYQIIKQSSLFKGCNRKDTVIPVTFKKFNIGTK